VLGLARKEGIEAAEQRDAVGCAGLSAASVFQSPTGPSGVTRVQTRRAHCIANSESRISSSTE
jgi:hypothetical protein